MSLLSPSSARWIIIPPFRNNLAWRAAVVAAATEASLRVHDLDVDASHAPFDDARAIILTSDPQAALNAGVTVQALAGIIAEPGMRLAGDEDPNALPSDIAALTDLMARSGLLPADRTFRSADFAAGPIEVLPGVKVRRPAAAVDAPSPRLRAVVEATRLLDPAHPEATWAPELFNYDSRTVPGGTCGQLDLTGRPRFMITGPYITLPPGQWRATYRLTFDAKGSRPRFRVDWGSQADFVSKEFVPGRAGVFEITQDYVWTERAPCELRIVVMEGVFDGRMTFSGARIERIG